MFKVGNSVGWDSDDYSAGALCEVEDKAALPGKKFRLTEDGALLSRVAGVGFFSFIKYIDGAIPGHPMPPEVRILAARRMREFILKNNAVIIFGADFLGHKSRGRYKTAPPGSQTTFDFSRPPNLP